MGHTGEINLRDEDHEDLDDEDHHHDPRDEDHGLRLPHDVGHGVLACALHSLRVFLARHACSSGIYPSFYQFQ